MAAHENIETLYNVYARTIGSFLKRRLGDAELSQDASQEVFVRLMRHGRLDKVRFPQAYLFQIAAHVVCEIKRREKQRPVTFDSSVTDRAVGQETSIEAAFEASSEAGAVLSELSPLRTAIVLLRMQEGMSHAEIAAALEISAHTVKKYLRLALLQCRRSKAESRNTLRRERNCTGR